MKLATLCVPFLVLSIAACTDDVDDSWPCAARRGDPAFPTEVTDITYAYDAQHRITLAVEREDGAVAYERRVAYEGELEVMSEETYFDAGGTVSSSSRTTNEVADGRVVRRTFEYEGAGSSGRAVDDWIYGSDGLVERRTGTHSAGHTYTYAYARPDATTEIERFCTSDRDDCDVTTRRGGAAWTELLLDSNEDGVIDDHRTRELDGAGRVLVEERRDGAELVWRNTVERKDNGAPLHEVIDWGSRRVETDYLYSCSSE